MPAIDRDFILTAMAPWLETSEPNGSGWYYARCPLHDDSKRSFGFNIDEDSWSCRAGCGNGSIMELAYRLTHERKAEGTSRAREQAEETGTGFTDDDDVIDLEQSRARRRRKSSMPAPTDEQLDHWVSVLQSRQDKLDEMVEGRGLNPETLKEYSIGWCAEQAGGHGAFVLPMFDGDGQLTAVRLYRPDAPTKMWWWTAPTLDTSVLYPESALESREVMICEGEWDTLVARQMGFNAITGTTGAEQWQDKWSHRFTGKDVILIYDRDKAGVRGAEAVARRLASHARSIRIAELPLPYTEKHGADLSDFVIKHDATIEDIKQVIKGSRVFEAPKDGDATTVTVKESYNPELSGTAMSMTVSVVGKGLQTHLVPKRVSFTCGINADKKCLGCPMKDRGGVIDLEVDPKSDLILKMRDVNDIKRDDVLREFIGAHKCGKMTTDIEEFQTTELLVVRTSIEDDEEDGDHRSRSIVNVGEYRTEANSLVRLTGTTYPSPSSQESIFQAWSLDPVESSLDTYQMTDRDLELMKMFQTGRRQTPLKKLGDIARDLSANVTHIIGRIDLHVAMDLVWHSALTFNFSGAPMERGWLDLLVVGDARTGKSEVAAQLLRHYHAGRMVSCESASIPGLLGAVKPMPGASKSWTLEWGIIPLNDRRLVTLDEAGGLSTDQISQMSSLRSSGIAEIVKAEREQTRSRTRLIWLANPRNNQHGMAAYMYGVHAIAPLIGTQEDIARFDFAMSLASGDVPLEDINKPQHSRVPHRYTSEACHALIQWVWSRQRDHIKWSSKAEDLVYKEALRLGRKYVPDPPLIQGQNVRQKLARLAVAVAARTFSTKDGEVLLVESRHVESAVQFLEYVYGNESFGYAEISQRAKMEEEEAVKSMDEVKQYIYARRGLARFLISTGGTFRRQQMEEQLNYAREEANVVIQMLSEMGMIKSVDSWDYRVQPHLNTVLREMTKMKEV